MEKYCPRCKVKTPKSNFSKDPSRYDGLSSYCKKCHCEHNAKYCKNYQQTDKGKKSSRKSRVFIYLKHQEEIKNADLFV